MTPRDTPVEYTCRTCGNTFTVMQAEGGRDEDIDLCWDCTGRLLATADTVTRQPPA